MATGWDAFISYAHAASGDTAVALQRGLERFARPWHRRRIVRVFRDDNALSTNPALWNAIEEGLSSAHHLIVLLSRGVGVRRPRGALVARPQGAGVGAADARRR